VVFQDARGSLGEQPDQPQSAVQVEHVVIGKLLAVEHRRRAEIGASCPGVNVEGRALVRILAVTQRALTEEPGKQDGREEARLANLARRLLEVGSDHRVVPRGLVEGRQSQRATKIARRASVASISLSRRSYCDGEVTTATCAWFLAAARIKDGPPMSMFSTASSKVAEGFATVSSNG